MIGTLLLLLPGMLTGRAGSMARREVKTWTKKNPTLNSLKYGPCRRLLLWNADHPMVFALFMGAIAAGIAYVISRAHWSFVPNLKSPVLAQQFDPAAYTGVPWGVQATLVALVYPIVLSFIALMLQRKAHSTVLLRVYVLDSAVVPAGASSIGLLLFMGVQYFAALYSTQSFLSTYMAMLLLINGVWFAGNIFLTGFFLSRTIRFVQDEEQRHAYTRVAVDIVLRDELASAVKQHIFFNAPYVDWGFPVEPSNPDSRPRVQSFILDGGKPVARRNLGGSQVLHDVHLRLLKWVVRSWCKRARLQHGGENERVPIICFPPEVGEVETGEVVLCSVENGPRLTFVEQALVRAAFCYRPSRQRSMSLSTKTMLDEIGRDVEAAAEQHRFGAAEDGLRNVIRLHKTLLLASVAGKKGVSDSAAVIGTSPYGWGRSSFDIEWLKPYREIGRIAVGILEEDVELRLFKALAVVPMSIAAELPPRPEKLTIDAMLVGMNLTYQLGGWWTRKADASLLPSATSFSGTLPAPLSKVYEQVLIAFVGSWGHVYIGLPKSKTADSAYMWSALTARALVYAKHIENSAEMFLKAVSRGDEAASIWFLDSFLKWWGNRQHELEYGDPDEYQVRHVTLSLADKTWDEAQRFLWDGSAPVTIDMAGKALSLAIRRYWESMRLYLVLLLIQKAGPAPAADSRELRLAGALVKGSAQKHGGRVDCWALDNVDAVTTAILGAEFGVERIGCRIDEFAEKLQWANETPQVSGWIYGWSGNPFDFASMKLTQAILLVALAASRGRHVGENKKLIESWWRDIDKLESAGRYCQDLCSQILSPDSRLAEPVVTAFRSHLGLTGSVRSAGISVARTLKALRKVALHERITTIRALEVDQQAVNTFAEQISTNAFGPQHWPSSAGTAIAFVAGVAADKQSVVFEDDKKRFVAGMPQQSDSSLAERIGENIRQLALAWSFSKRVAEVGLTSANHITLRNNFQATVEQVQGFVSSVAAQCAAIRASGADPVVLIGHAAPGSYLRPFRWGPNSWQAPLPAGVTLRNSDPSKGEPATVFINDAPVFSFDTPNGDCYVVPSTLVHTLVVAGTSPSSALNVTWTHVSEERLKFVVSWQAQFC